MMKFQWQNLLEQLNDKLLLSIDKELPEVINSNWLGNAGATEEEIKIVEKRIGTTLPPSYREFLTVSNGWNKSNWGDFKLYSTKDIDWLCIKDWTWTKLAQYIPEDIPSVSDEYYFIYGEKQDCCHYRMEYLETALKISSDSGDGDCYLLIPEVINDQEEWEAWYLGSKLPGAYRYQSFYDLMKNVAKYGSFIY